MPFEKLTTSLIIKEYLISKGTFTLIIWTSTTWQSNYWTVSWRSLSLCSPSVLKVPILLFSSVAMTYITYVRQGHDPLSLTELVTELDQFSTYLQHSFQKILDNNRPKVR